MPQLRAESANGNPEADFQLGFMASMGRIPGESTVKAYEYLRRAADSGHLEASFLLGTLYIKGLGGQQPSPEAGERYLRQAADRGHARAQDKLGQFYTTERNNPGEAAKWFRMAADQGLASAENNLGLLHVEGKGVEKNPARAVELITSAANKGQAAAKYNLGVLYHSGNGVAADLARARQFLEEAATQGYQQAYYRLAMINLDKNGQGQNPVEALKWLMLASSGEDGAFRRYSRAMLTQLIQQTSPIMVNDAAEAARLWAMRHQMNAPYQANQD
ncbi:MAG: tetratricopeptide repeat protein [Pseudomonadota bacterium]